MIRYFRALLSAVEAIATGLGAVCEAVHGLDTRGRHSDGLDGRVAALEREMERRHAEAEGLLLKASGKFDAARAAEERARRLADRAESGDEERLEEIVEAYAQAGLPLHDAPNGDGETLQPVHGRVAGRHDSKSSAYAMKWGR